MASEKSLQQRIDEAVREEISVVPYDPDWPRLFALEAEFLRKALPAEVVGRIEHFGSTAVPNLSAKPIIDVLIEVSSLDKAKERIVPCLESEGYDYFWRTDVPNPYAWFIKRDENGNRTHHLHFVEADSELWERLYFRDYLREFPDEAKRYEDLKISLCGRFPRNRVAYTKGKTEYILETTGKARHYFMNKNIINSEAAPEPVGLYPHARRVGNLLFLSGVGPRERGTSKIPGVEIGAGGEILSYDIEAQCHSVFRNVRSIVETAGSGWEKIIDITVFLTNMKDDFGTYNKIYAEYFAENQPCRTTVEVGRLPTPIAIELKVIAVID